MQSERRPNLLYQRLSQALHHGHEVRIKVADSSFFRSARLLRL